MEDNKGKKGIKVNMYFNGKGESLQKIMERNLKTLVIR